MKTLMTAEVLLLILAGIIAPLIAIAPIKENRPKAYFILVVMIGLSMFALDQWLMSNTGRDLSEHINCMAVPDGVPCRETKQAEAMLAPQTQPPLPVESTEETLSPAETFALGLTADGAKDYVTARAFYTQACDGRNASACANLGFLWSTGEGGDIDKARARALYERACNGGSSMGCNNLAFLLDNGEGGDINKARARALFKRACEGGVELGCRNFRTVDP